MRKFGGPTACRIHPHPPSRAEEPRREEPIAKHVEGKTSRMHAGIVFGSNHPSTGHLRCKCRWLVPPRHSPDASVITRWSSYNPCPSLTVIRSGSGPCEVHCSCRLEAFCEHMCMFIRTHVSLEAEHVATAVSLRHDMSSSTTSAASCLILSRNVISWILFGWFLSSCAS